MNLGFSRVDCRGDLCRTTLILISAAIATQSPTIRAIWSNLKLRRLINHGAKHAGYKVLLLNRRVAGNLICKKQEHSQLPFKVELRLNDTLIQCWVVHFSRRLARLHIALHKKSHPVSIAKFSCNWQCFASLAT